MNTIASQLIPAQPHTFTLFFFITATCTAMEPLRRPRKRPRVHQSLLTCLLRGQRQQGMIEEEIRLADTSKLVPGLSETDIIQQLVSVHSIRSPTFD